MSICSYLLPPNAGEKIYLNGFAFVVCCGYLIFFSLTLPFHSTEVPIIVMFYSNTAALVGIGMLLNVACISMARVRKYAGPPKCLKRAFAGPLGRFLCLGHYYSVVSSTHQRLNLELNDLADGEAEEPEDEQSNGHANIEGSNAGNPFPKHATHFEESGVMKDWMLVAAGLERLFFLLYTLIFAVVTSVYV